MGIDHVERVPGVVGQIFGRGCGDKARGVSAHDHQFVTDVHRLMSGSRDAHFGQVVDLHLDHRIDHSRGVAGGQGRQRNHDVAQEYEQSAVHAAKLRF